LVGFDDVFQSNKIMFLMKVKFLIIRFSSIGDIVLTTPVVRCLKEQVEGAEVHYVTKKQFASILTPNPYIDKVHILDGSLNKLIGELKLESFDYIIDLHHNLRSLIIKMRLRRLAFSFDKLNYEKWLMVHFKKNKLPNSHIVDRYLDTCNLFDIQNDNKGLDFFIETKNEVPISTLPTSFLHGYVALVIGAKHATKQMPDAKLAELCKKISHPVILLGGSEDKEKAELIIKLTSKESVFNACGKFNLQQSASLVKQAKVVVTHDTGLMHIAAAFKQRIISIWGNTIPEFGMYPYIPGFDQSIFEIKGLNCRPCSKIGYNSCPKTHFNCMNQQNVDSIAHECNGLYLK
jgi:ADP-heptose:LPS heptosyltransferase